MNDASKTKTKASSAASSSSTATHDSPPTPLTVSPPSFNAYTSGNCLHQIAARVILELGDARHSSGLDDDHLLYSGRGRPEPNPAIPEDELKKLVVADTDEEDDEDGCPYEDSDDDGDFEFAFVRRDPDTAEIAADELFSNGQIRPAFPVFERSLLDDDDSGAASVSAEKSGSIMLPLRKLSVAEAPIRPPPSSDQGGDGVTPYRVWTPRSPAVPPPPGQCKKSRSTGSSSRRWRLRDLIHRSSSDGKDAFVFMPAPATATAAAVCPLENAKGKNVNSYNGLKKKKIMGPVSAHEMYLRSRPTKEDDRRRSFLPYRPGIMGFFSNPSQ